ncbi:hypothetical protein MEG1DRAFT_01031 [Photorhabdus temperata subsp. temperata Meg1]|uniref:Uncharacterized protein n=1 Tax=Photorhabdus temperata subsp. temperata Meg1 TaxID=1393735 RepID=A0A081S008_PHOTE|nr:hypothetical protein MEG1DRAFT_01031 [Photorhabdus temperata subsp. temperata Meg1]
MELFNRNIRKEFLFFAHRPIWFKSGAKILILVFHELEDPHQAPHTYIIFADLSQAPYIIQKHCNLPAVYLYHGQIIACSKSQPSF